MAIIGTICPRIPGHLNPMTTLCRELQRRGHRVIFYQAPMAAEKIRSRGFEMRCFGEKEYSLEEDLKNQEVQATLSGYKAFRHTRDSIIRAIRVVIRQVPAMLREDNIEADAGGPGFHGRWDGVGISRPAISDDLQCTDGQPG